MIRGGLALVLVACGGPTADIVCTYEADGLNGADAGEYTAFTFACEDWQRVGEGLATEEEDICEADLLGGGASTAVCTCETVAGSGCTPPAGLDGP